MKSPRICPLNFFRPLRPWFTPFTNRNDLIFQHDVPQSTSASDEPVELAFF